MLATNANIFFGKCLLFDYLSVIRLGPGLIMTLLSHVYPVYWLNLFPFELKVAVRWQT